MRPISKLCHNKRKLKASFQMKIWTSRSNTLTRNNILKSRSLSLTSNKSSWLSSKESSIRLERLATPKEVAVELASQELRLAEFHPLVRGQ